MERVGVHAVGAGACQIVGGPGLEVRKGELVFDEVDDHPSELDSVATAEVDRLPVEDRVDCAIEIIRVDETDEVGDLVDPIRLVQGPEAFYLIGRNRSVTLGPISGEIDRAVSEERTELAAQMRLSIPTLSRSGVTGRIE